MKEEHGRGSRTAAIGFGQGKKLKIPPIT